jgi:uncharacterized membrane protein
MQTEAWAIGLVILATMVGSFGPILLKKAASKIELSIKALSKNCNLILGFVLYGLATLLFIPALRGGELSVLYPLTSISYIWVSLLSMWFLREKMNALKWLGILFVIAGVVLISSQGA